MAKSVLPVFYVKEDRGVHQLVNIQINGLPARMLIDTGASHTVFCQRRIHYFAAKFPYQDPTFHAMGMGENFEAYVLPVRSFTVGKIQIPHYEVIMSDLTLLEQLFGRLIEGPVHGVLGGDLLTLPGSLISFRKQLLRLGNSRALRFRALSVVPGASHLVVQIKIMGKKVNMFIDTGATVTIFNSRRFHQIVEFDENLLEPVDEPCKGVKDEYAPLGNVNFNTLEIGHVVLHDFSGKLIDLENVNHAYLRLGFPPLDGIMGNDLLSALKVELFCADQKLIVRS